ncbi:dihydroneopterin triphosphate pyrophosphatase [Corynebacterium kalinowskii]|uniref:Dihydroneopterin triphosphate pyrophosphatase n=1 Tax=Corynebacterium kalinowskii TaxID=2675216 RepID=A0A6B8VPC8_9CORY|nr:NUDIX domain-containing protein [Corynebacterium kalinowskii]QGU03264.1 dihydroneopterin triphosphate pyrophosphatase [Corynebacterium kalinowskii]
MTPEFILDLRKKIGHTELWLPGVTAIILKGDEVLLVKRSDNGEWTPVTGICDPREEPHVTAVREAKEETGLEVAVEKLLWVQAVGPVEYPNGDVTSYVDTAFVCRPTADTDPYPADDESTDVAWFHVKHLPPMQPRFSHLIQAAREGISGFGSQNS